MYIENCELCEREGLETTEHHLTPKEEGGTHMPTAYLCVPCHTQIHALYTNKELATRLNTIEKLKADELVSKFINWIQKQPPTASVRIKKSNDKKSKQKSR